MLDISFDTQLIKQDNVDVIKLIAKNKNKVVETFFSPPLSPAELVIDLTATLNSLVHELDKLG